jgi:uncharacterized RDD family membrane protein YckC
VSSLDTDVAIETPEHVVFRYRIAGPARRSIAYLLDFIICGLVLGIIGLVVLLAFGLMGAAVAQSDGGFKAGGGVALVIAFIAEWVWRIAFEGFTGTSPGKKIMGLRVVTTEGRTIGFGRAILRNLLRAADVLPAGYLMGVLTMSATRKFQRLGDLVAGTMVVIPERRMLAAQLVLYPPLQRQELYVYECPVTLSPDELRSIELLLRRRMQLPYSHQAELAMMIAKPLERHYGLRHPDPVRLLALLYDRSQRGRADAAQELAAAPPPDPRLPPPGYPGHNAGFGAPPSGGAYGEPSYPQQPIQHGLPYGQNGPYGGRP